MSVLEQLRLSGVSDTEITKVLSQAFRNVLTLEGKTVYFLARKGAALSVERGLVEKQADVTLSVKTANSPCIVLDSSQVFETEESLKRSLEQCICSLRSEQPKKWRPDRKKTRGMNLLPTTEERQKFDAFFSQYKVSRSENTSAQELINSFQTICGMHPNSWRKFVGYIRNQYGVKSQNVKSASGVYRIHYPLVAKNKPLAWKADTPKQVVTVLRKFV